MNILKTKRRAIHIFFSSALFIFSATPVLALTADLASPQTQDVIPVTKALVLVTPKPLHSNSEVMGPHKPEEEKTTPTPTPTKSPTATPTKAPTPTQATPTPTTKLSPTTAPAAPTAASSNTSTGGLNADVLFSMSNNYRTGKGLPPFQTDERICALASARAPQISAEISGGYMHAGKDSHGFPYWFTENIIEFRTEAEAFNWWVNDYIHRVQIEEPNTHSCVACSGNACVQLFTSFKPK
jgi:uncharacterized protein YkwD